MIHYRNSIPENGKPEEMAVSGFEERYRNILQKTGEEYEDIPPGRYYRDGYNLYLRMEGYMENHLLFLHDLRVPVTNNEAERLLRNYKRKHTLGLAWMTVIWQYPASRILCLHFKGRHFLEAKMLI